MSNHNVRALEYPSRLPVAGTALFCDYKFDGMKLPQGDSHATRQSIVVTPNCQFFIVRTRQLAGWVQYSTASQRPSGLNCCPPPPPRSPPGLLEVYERVYTEYLTWTEYVIVPSSELAAGPAANIYSQNDYRPTIYLILSYPCEIGRRLPVVAHGRKGVEQNPTKGLERRLLYNYSCVYLRSNHSNNGRLLYLVLFWIDF